MHALSGLTIPPSQCAYYRKARLLTYTLVFIIVGNFLLEVLFPTFLFPFDFRTPDSLKNTLTDPRDRENNSLENGKIDETDTLVATASAFGRFSHAEVRATLEKDSPVPEKLTVTLRRSYRSFFYPTGEPLAGFPAGKRYRIADTYYELRDDTLYPYVSEGAFLSRYPLSFAEVQVSDFLKQFSVSEQWLGYRPGSLLAFGDGVFVVTNEEEVRPVGSADIFLRLGYRFEDVRPASAEEVGIYKRGRIILLGAPHPDGTLFLDTDSGSYSLIENRQKRPLIDPVYRDFLLAHNGSIAASGKDAEELTQCAASPSFSGHTLRCQVSLGALANNLGNDYEVSLSNNNKSIELERLAVSLQSEKSMMSARRLLNQVKVRFLIRFGYAEQ